jgi:hypothetical protein
MKELILTFGYNNILELCERKGWELPSSKDLIYSKEKFVHESVWVTDTPEKEEDVETHAYVYNFKRNKLILCNKNFKEHVVVKRNKDV